MRSALCALVLGLTVMPLAGSLSPLSTAAAASSVTRQMVVNEAMQFHHYRYALTGSSPKTGFSCIGFVWYVFQSLGIDMPGNLSSAIAAYPRIRERDLLPGDIIFFQNTWWKGLSHVAIYIGHGRVIHAENFTRGVSISALRNDPVEGSYYQEHYLTAERVLTGAAAAPYASPGHGQAVVSVPSLNFRANPSLSAVVMTVVTRGTSLSVSGSWNGWLHVSTGDLTGWVVQAGVQLDSRTSAGTPGGHHRASGHRARRYAILPGVNIHDGPALTDTVISATTTGMTVRVLGRRNPFTHIQTPSGLSGWVMTRFIEGTVSTGRRTNHGGARAKQVLTIRAHLRTGPSLYDRIIEWVPAGTRLAVLGHVPLWDHVRLSAKLSGYIYASFIRP
jgi:uncharacterized protein YgiM (DUF1202 family)